MQDQQEIEEILDRALKQGHRIDDDWIESEFYHKGVKTAEEYWTSPNRHPATSIRELLKLTKTSREYLDAKYGFRKRMREIENTIIESGEVPKFGS